MSSMPPPPPPPSFPPAPPPSFSGGGFGAATTGERASFGARLGANLLDGLLYGLLSLIPIIAGFASFGAAAADCSGDGDYSTSCGPGELKGGLVAIGVLLIILGFIGVWIVQVRHLAIRGQTWGRKIVGIKVVTADSGLPIGYGKAFGRSIFANLISGSFCALGYLWMLWDKDKQTWHDKVVGSVVVRA